MNDLTPTGDPRLLEGLILAILLGGAGALFLVINGRRHPEPRTQLTIFLVGFAARFILSLAIYQFGLVAVFKDEDAVGWYEGVKYMRQWESQGITIWELPGTALTQAGKYQNKGYFFLLAVYYTITGLPGRLPACALNALVGAMTAVFAYRIARVLFSEWVARRVGWWTCLFPSMILWSAMTLKEPMVIFLETVALYGCVRLQEKGVSLRYIALCAVTITVLILFRFYAAYIVGLAVIFALFARFIFQPGKGISALIVLGIVAPLVLATGALGRHQRELERLDTERMKQYKQAIASGGTTQGAGSGVESNFNLSSPLGFAQALAFGGAHLALAPFPWQIRAGSMRTLLTVPELMVWWWMFFVGVIPGMVYLVRHRLKDVSVILLFIAGFGLLYSIMFANVGLVFRQRAQLLPWLFIFAAVGLEHRAARKRQAMEWTMRRRAAAALRPQTVRRAALE